MNIRTSVLWKMNILMAKKWPEKVVQRSFIKRHSFRNSLCLRMFVYNLLSSFYVNKCLYLAMYVLCHFTGVEWVEISKRNFARFFGPRMFVRS